MAKTKHQIAVAAGLDAIGVDAICAWIEEDKSYRWIAQECGVSVSVLYRWIEATEERSARVAASRAFSAHACDDKAEIYLGTIPDDGTPAQIARARELASHMRWRAKVRNPQYGDKTETTVKGKLDINHGLQNLDPEKLRAFKDTLIAALPDT